MRVYHSKLLVSFGILVFLLSIGSGCGLLNDVLPKSKSDFSRSGITETSPSLSPSPALSESEKDHPSQWLLKPGLFDIDNGVWLGSIGLAIGLLGTGFSIHCSRSSNRLNRKLNDKQNRLARLEENSTKAYSTINQLSKIVNDSSTKLAQLQSICQQLEDKHASLLFTLNSQRLHQKPEQDPLASRLTRTVENPPVMSQTYIQSTQHKLAEITAAVNRGDRQVVRAEIRAQLNITNDSENAISMGRLNETQLEEVSAGGSYWIASSGNETWLFPTEQTLKGYSQSQRPTGIFTYIRQPIPSAQVVSPARLALNSSLWSVAEPGSIAVPD
ncbi:MAG: hypothetical protein KGQ59_11740 [Bdellovibrionales bacterium]|nr:hypothetical protein [Bdellovibrionales bacterium]